MTEDSKLNAAVELAKVAYEDAFKPPAKEVGKALGTVGEAVNLVLEPLRLVIWGYDEIKNFVHDKAVEKLEKRGVKEEDIITPDPDIAVPSIEALRYSKLKEEFAALLASSMDKNNFGKVHPSFVEILKQISADEAKMIKRLRTMGSPVPYVEIFFHEGGEESFRPQGDFYGNIAREANCDFPENTDSYMINMYRLGLLEKIASIQLSNDEKYTSIVAAHPMSKALLDEQNKELRYTKRVFRISPLGVLFLRFCLT